jgi:hypothetical protein
MDKKLLVVGCSHAAGSEIDGTLDSRYNRENGFGNTFARYLNRQPVNIAVGGATNHTISRMTLNYIVENDIKGDDWFVLVAWSDSSRVEACIDWPNGHLPLFSEWLDVSNADFLRINQGSPPSNIDKENPLIDYWKVFSAEQSEWLEIYSLHNVLMLQYFLKSRNIPYLMCNAGWMVFNNMHNKHYLRHVDSSRYYEHNDPWKCFVKKFQILGYWNPKAIYWHHGLEPHQIYARELFDFYNANQ